ncbi:MAG: chemotaxis protein CheD [Roseateles depolymerans]|uniref:Probable chemoreceptor glutamine deamidase CheD n=1 Tax=Roseateles depolymerans TaxID=76731 RepID=A0A2W5DMX8_9BURK|nr:MAG: chemotaxis protein CheD [Roseateles depolymerans]
MKQTTVHLAPGDYFVGDARYRVRTLLGSCVSITLWNGAQRRGAMSHFLLADRPQRPRPQDPLGLDARYGNEALTLMLRRLARHDIRPQDCQAKVFGGANMFPRQGRSLRLPVGRRNGSAATEWLAQAGIEVVSTSLFGIGYRVIIFDIATGDVWARQAGGTEGEERPAPLRS